MKILRVVDIDGTETFPSREINNEIRDIVISPTPPPSTWQELHTRALAHNTDDSLWLHDFIQRVPNINCACRADAKNYVANNPPDWTHYFEWSIAFHNYVNAKLSKPILTIEEAGAIWE